MYVCICYLVAWLAIVCIAGRSTARIGALINWLPVGDIDTTEGQLSLPTGPRITFHCWRSE